MNSMFIKWLRIRAAELFKIHKNTIEVFYVIWFLVAAACFILEIIAATSPSTYQANVQRPYILFYAHYYIFPLAFLTILVPISIKLCINLGKLIHNEWLDYSYYASTGGKRKRDESTPIKENDRDFLQELLDSEDGYLEEDDLDNEDLFYESEDNDVNSKRTSDDNEESPTIPPWLTS